MLQVMQRALRCLASNIKAWRAPTAQDRLSLEDTRTIWKWFQLPGERASLTETPELKILVKLLMRSMPHMVAKWDGYGLGRMMFLIELKKAWDKQQATDRMQSAGTSADIGQVSAEGTPIEPQTTQVKNTKRYQ
jgi:hypothetical protein